MPKALSERKIKGVFERPAGSNIWWVDYSIGGRRVREKVGNKSDAVKAYEKRRREAWTDTKVPSAKRLLFGSLIDDALTHSENQRQKDTKTLKVRLGKIKEEMGKQPSDRITSDVIRAWLAAHTKTPATHNRYKAAFSKVFKVAIQSGLIGNNPTRNVDSLKESGQRIRHLAKGSDEETRLRAAITKLSPKHLPELTISIGSGMRLSEQYSLTWDNVRFDRGKFGYIELNETKNGTYRDIPMSPEVRDAFKEVQANAQRALAARVKKYRAKSNELKSDDRVFSVKTPRKWFEAAIAEAGINDYTWHCNRHTFCSRLAKAGVHIRTIQQLAGHKTICISARYTHMEDEVVAAAVLGIM